MTPQELEMYLRALETDQLPSMGASLFQDAGPAAPLGYESVPTDQLPSMGVSNFRAPGSGGMPMESLGAEANQFSNVQEEPDMLAQLLEQVLAPREAQDPSEEYQKEMQRKALFAMGAAMLAYEGDNFGTAIGQGGQAYSQMMQDADKEERNRIILRGGQEDRRLSSAAGIASDISSRDVSQDNLETGRTREDEFIDENRVIKERERTEDAAAKVEAARISDENLSARQAETQGAYDARQGDSQAFQRESEQREELRARMNHLENIASEMQGDNRLGVTINTTPEQLAQMRAREIKELSASSDSKKPMKYNQISAALENVAREYAMAYQHRGMEGLVEEWTRDHPEDTLTEGQFGLPIGLYNLMANFLGTAKIERPEPGPD